MIRTVGSVCSGIEAASVAWSPLGYSFSWFSEIAEFPSAVLQSRYPRVKNLGDMTGIPALIGKGQVDAPDLICGGTPCQAFSFAGFQNGLNDDRGNLTLKFVDIIDSNDKARINLGKNRSIVFWENVEGVLSDKTNAFGCLISYLAGLSEPLIQDKWPRAGVLRGPRRNVAWRVIDAKYYGLPQQRRRLYVLAGGKDFAPENVLFELSSNQSLDNADSFPQGQLTFEKQGHTFEIFRGYTDCLYAAYGTKWNGNAAAMNGSLFVVQDGRIRRLSPLECERLMGFPDGYTALEGAKRTARYTAIGNSWAVPVVRWLGSRLNKGFASPMDFGENKLLIPDDGYQYFDLSHTKYWVANQLVNATTMPNECVFGTMADIVSPDAPTDIYLSPVACQGILRRAQTKHCNINVRLSEVLASIASTMSTEEIEKLSRRQPRGSESGMSKLTRRNKERAASAVLLSR